MNYFLPADDIFDGLSRHLLMSVTGKGHQALLYYGHPGQGKTRFFRELIGALTQQPGYDEYVLSKLRSFGIFETEWTIAVISFNTDTKASMIDADLCKLQSCLPAWIRLFYVYFVHNYDLERDGFTRLMADFHELLTDGNFDHTSISVGALLDAIMSKSGKPRIALFVEESLLLNDRLKFTVSPSLDSSYSHPLFVQFMSELNGLQDFSPTFPVVYSGLLDGPWMMESSATQRVLVKRLLQPYPLSSMTLTWITQAQLSNLSSIYELRKDDGLQTVESTIALYLFELSMGLGRAIEVIRTELNEFRVPKTLAEFVRKCSDSMGQLYPVLATSSIVNLALFGGIVGGSWRMKLQSAMSMGQCMLLADDPLAANFVKVLITPLRLFGLNYKLDELTAMVLMTVNMSTKNFENFLLCHERMMRPVRRYIMSMDREDIPLKIDYTNCTFEELLFGKTGLSDIEAEWRSESLRYERFNFTLDLTSCIMEVGSFPNYSDRHRFINCTIMPADVNQKGFEFGWIVQSLSGFTVGVLEQAKLTEVGTEQSAGEVFSSAVSSVEVLHEAVYRRVGETCKKMRDSLGWPEENIIVIFRTNRERLKYKKVLIGINVILMCKQSLESYLGPTIWSLFSISENLANLKLKAIY